MEETWRNGHHPPHHMAHMPTMNGCYWGAINYQKMRGTRESSVDLCNLRIGSSVFSTIYNRCECHKFNNTRHKKLTSLDTREAHGELKTTRVLESLRDHTVKSTNQPTDSVTVVRSPALAVTLLSWRVQDWGWGRRAVVPASPAHFGNVSGGGRSLSIVVW